MARALSQKEMRRMHSLGPSQRDLNSASNNNGLSQQRSHYRTNSFDDNASYMTADNQSARSKSVYSTNVGGREEQLSRTYSYSQRDLLINKVHRDNISALENVASLFDRMLCIPTLDLIHRKLPPKQNHNA